MSDKTAEPCGIRYVGGFHSTWKCDTCGYKQIHDAHPGCRRPPVPHAQVASDAEDAARWRRLVNASDLPFPVATIAELDLLRTSPAPADSRKCTCHPDDRPQTCQRLFAESDCQRAYSAKQSGPSDEQLCEIEHAVEALRLIAGGANVVGDGVERISDIRRARGIAAIAHRRLEAVAVALAAQASGPDQAGGTQP